jgi:N-acetylglucosaminyl-diphospho-decaprenol L-rhamnosyltransferase
VSAAHSATPGRLPVRDVALEPAIVLSILIGTYNARDLLVDCLQSIYRNAPRESFEIIVVDDASTDGTSETVSARFPEVRLLRNEINRNYATVNNQAFQLARGRYIYLLNNDTIVLPDALDRMLTFLREHPDAGAVGSRVLNEDGTIQWTVKSLPSIDAALFGARSIISRLYPDNRFSRKQLLHLGRDMTTPFVAGYVSGASVMHPCEVVEKVGDLDERLFYFVDADYCKRIADAGYKCYYLPTATIIHLNHKGGSLSSLRRRFRSVLAFHVASYIYYLKHLQRSPWSLMNVVVLGSLFARFLIALSMQACAEVTGLMGSFYRQRRPVR